MWNCLHSPLHRCPSQVKGVDSRSTASASWVRIPLCARTSTQVWLKGMDLRSIASASRVRIPSCALFFCKIIVTASPLSPLATHGSTRYLRWRLRGAVPISRRNIRRSPVVRIRRRRTADDVSLPDTADAPHDGEDVCGVDASRRHAVSARSSTSCGCTTGSPSTTSAPLAYFVPFRKPGLSLAFHPSFRPSAHFHVFVTSFPAYAHLRPSAS